MGKLLHEAKVYFSRRKYDQFPFVWYRKHSDILYLEVSVSCDCLRGSEVVLLLSLVLCRHTCVLWTRESLPGRDRGGRELWHRLLCMMPHSALFPNELPLAAQPCTDSGDFSAPGVPSCSGAHESQRCCLPRYPTYP